MATETNHRPETESGEKLWWQPGIAVFGEVTGWIVVPVIAALYGGRYLDEKQGTGNAYFLGLTALAFIISCIGIALLGKRYIKMVEESKKAKNNGNESEQRN
jgi:Kef-type K+ transport system membrane component KefB